MSASGSVKEATVVYSWYSCIMVTSTYMTKLAKAQNTNLFRINSRICSSVVTPQCQWQGFAMEMKEIMLIMLTGADCNVTGESVEWKASHIDTKWSHNKQKSVHTWQKVPLKLSPLKESDNTMENTGCDLKSTVTQSQWQGEPAERCMWLEPHFVPTNISGENIPRERLRG